MHGKNIPGSLDMAALRTLFGIEQTQPEAAQAHAPRDRFETRRAVVDLLGRGYKPADVAGVLKLTVATVKELAVEAQRLDTDKIKRWTK